MFFGGIFDSVVAQPGTPLSEVEKFDDSGQFFQIAE